MFSYQEKHSEMDVEKRLRLVCNFCNAILPSKKEATKDAFIRQLEESHNIVQNADDASFFIVFLMKTNQHSRRRKGHPLKTSLDW